MFSLQCCGFLVQRPSLFFVFVPSLWFVFCSCLFERHSVCLRPVSLCLCRVSMCERRISVCFRHVSVCLRCPLCICATFCLFALRLWAFAPTISFVYLRHALGALLPPSICSGCWLLGIFPRSLSSSATNCFFLYARTVVSDFLFSCGLTCCSTESSLRVVCGTHDFFRCFHISLPSPPKCRSLILIPHVHSG